MRYLLDTNILSNLVRHPQGMVMRQIGRVGEEQVCTSIVVAAELRCGVAKRGSPRLTAQLEAVLGAIEILPLEAPADRTYARLRARLEKEGTPIGGNDMLIAAQVLALGYCIVTDNEQEFSRVPELVCDTLALAHSLPSAKVAIMCLALDVQELMAYELLK